jgi:hypothetical protein
MPLPALAGEALLLLAGLLLVVLLLGVDPGVV